MTEFVSKLPLGLFLVSCAASPGLSAREVADASDTGRAEAAHTETERHLLSMLPNLPTGAPRHVDAVEVTAEAPYTAASGRTCRALALSAGAGADASHRLACSDGSSWFFVPDVFSPPPPTRTE